MVVSPSPPLDRSHAVEISREGAKTQRPELVKVNPGWNESHQKVTGTSKPKNIFTLCVFASLRDYVEVFCMLTVEERAGERRLHLSEIDLVVCGGQSLQTG